MRNAIKWIILIAIGGAIPLAAVALIINLNGADVPAWLATASSSPFTQAYLGAFAGGLGGLIASIYYNRSEKLSRETQLMINEYFSPMVLDARIGAYKELNARDDTGSLIIDDNKRSDLDALFDGAEGVKDLRKLFSFFESLGARIRSSALDTSMIKKSMGDQVAYWLDIFDPIINGTDAPSWNTAKANLKACEATRA